MEKEYFMGTGVKQWMDGKVYNITFIVTEDCNLRCSYCYEVNKNDKKTMSIETAKKAVDYLLNNSDMFVSDAVVWDFIGGEPLLEIDLIDKICDYIKLETYRRRHKWMSNYRFNIGTNGILYGDPKVTKYIRKNKNKLSIGITIDGTKRKHDLHRVYKDGRGSYDDVYKNVKKWLTDMPNSTTKVTFGSKDLKYLFESIVHLYKIGFTEIPANVVYEDVWEKGDNEIFETQLKLLADYIIENKLWNKFNCTFFDDNLGKPVDKEILKSNHCGTGRMLAIDADGNFYPCLRFSSFTLSNKKGRTIGNLDEGIISDKVRPFLALSTENVSNKECLECEIASGCGWCQGCNYDFSRDDSIFNRVTSGEDEIRVKIGHLILKPLV